MSFDALETFLAIERSGSFHAAARQLNITQTAVSARIRVLEDRLGTTLFDRGRGGTRLSAAGRRFLPHAEQMLRTWSVVSADLSGAFRDRVALRLGSQLSVWDALLVDVAVWVEKDMGKVPVTLNYDHALNMAEAVRQQLLDVAIVTDVPAGTRLGVAEFAPERLVLVSDAPVRLDAAELPLFINLDLGAAYEAQARAVIPALGRQHIVMGNAAMGLRYLRRRGGMGFFPRALVDGPLAKGRLHAVEGAPEMELPCAALYLSDSPARHNVAEVLRGLHELRGAG